MPREPRPEDRVILRIEISTSHRDRLAIAAARRKQSMAACMRQVVSEWVDEVEPAEEAIKPKKRKEKSE